MYFLLSILFYGVSKDLATLLFKVTFYHEHEGNFIGEPSAYSVNCCSLHSSDIYGLLTKPHPSVNLINTNRVQHNKTATTESCRGKENKKKA